MLPAMLRILGLIFAIFALGCHFEDEFPTPTPVPADCSAVNATGNGSAVVGAQNALGAPDQKVATISAYGVLQLAVGRDISNNAGSNDDFEIIGKVNSTGVVTQGTCPLSASGAAVFKVEVSQDGTKFETVGFWTQKVKTFDLGCRSMKSARYIRIVGLAGASGEVDAIRSTSCFSL